jgi:hypothetical protein
VHNNNDIVQVTQYTNMLGPMQWWYYLRSTRRVANEHLPTFSVQILIYQ